MLAGSTQALWVESIANDRIDNPMKPDFIVTVALYPVDRGRKHPIVGQWFSCPCKFDPGDHTAWDCRILTNGETLSPGETKEFGIVFLTPEAGRLFSTVSKFYLWEGQIIGEARCVSDNSN
jgi:hypothetical protein